MELLKELLLGYCGLENTLTSLIVGRNYKTGNNCVQKCKLPTNIVDFFEMLDRRSEYDYPFNKEFVGAFKNIFRQSKELQEKFKLQSVKDYSSNILDDMDSFLQNEFISQSYEKMHMKNYPVEYSKGEGPRTILGLSFMELYYDSIMELIGIIRRFKNYPKNGEIDGCLLYQHRLEKFGPYSYLPNEFVKKFISGAIIENTHNKKKYKFINKHACPLLSGCDHVYVYESEHEINGKHIYYILFNYGTYIELYNQTNIDLIVACLEFANTVLLNYIKEDIYIVLGGHSAGAVVSYYLAECLRITNEDLLNILKEPLSEYSDIKTAERSRESLSEYINIINDIPWKKMQKITKNNLIVLATGGYASMPSKENTYPDIHKLIKYYDNRLIHIGYVRDEYLKINIHNGMLDTNMLLLKKEYEFVIEQPGYQSENKIEIMFTEIGHFANMPIYKDKIKLDFYSKQNHALSTFIDLLDKLSYDDDAIMKIASKYNLGSDIRLGGNIYEQKYLKYKQKYLQLKNM